MAPWDTGTGTVTDAFKPDQVPGASGPIGMGVTGDARRRWQRRTADRHGGCMAGLTTAGRAVLTRRLP